jgi:hypothetical protein
VSTETDDEPTKILSANVLRDLTARATPLQRRAERYAVEQVAQIGDASIAGAYSRGELPALLALMLTDAYRAGYEANEPIDLEPEGGSR